MVVGFIKRKSKVLLSSETALDRKGKVDGSSLLDGDGEPNSTSLYEQQQKAKNGKTTKRKDSKEDDNNADLMMNQNPIFPPQQPQAFGHQTNGFGHGMNGGYGDNQYGNSQYPHDPNQPYPPYNNQPQGFGNSNYPSTYMPQPEQEQKKTRRSWFGRKK